MSSSKNNAENCSISKSNNIEKVIDVKTEFYRQTAVDFFQFIYEAINEARLFLEDSRIFIKDIAYALMHKSEKTGKSGLEEIAEQFNEMSEGILNAPDGS